MAEAEEVSEGNRAPNVTYIIHDRSVRISGSAGNVNTGDNNRSVMSATLNIDHNQSNLQKLKERTASRMESWVSGMVRTAALEKVMQKLKAGSKWITIKGSPGEGKTTVAYMALQELHSVGREVFQVTSPEEMSEVIFTCPRPIIMLDDILGNLEFDLAEWRGWQAVLHEVLDEREHRSHEPVQQTPIKDVTVLLIGRDYVFNTASYDMGRLAAYFHKDEYVVNMSHGTERGVQEKRSIWYALSQPAGVELEQILVTTLCKLTCPHGFPHVCRLFVTMHKEDSTISAEAFFRNPLHFLNQTMASFMRNKMKRHLFQEMMKGDGKTSVRELRKLDNGYETIQTGSELVGTYLRKEGDCFVFDHPSVYDSVAYNLCNTDLLFVIESCNLSFIHERLCLQPSSNTCTDASSRESNLVVFIPSDYIGDLANRFATELLNGNLLQVLSHTAFSNDQFIHQVLSNPECSIRKLLKLTDSKTKEPFLSLVASNKSPQLLKYMDNHPDIQLNERDITTVLEGVCRYAASDVLTYLSTTRTLDINVRYGPWEETPLMLAVKTRDSEFVHQMMSLKPDLNARDIFRETAFDYMCTYGLVSVIEQMMDLGTDTDEQVSKGWSLLSVCRG